MPGHIFNMQDFKKLIENEKAVVMPTVMVRIVVEKILIRTVMVGIVEKNFITSQNIPKIGILHHFSMSFRAMTRSHTQNCTFSFRVKVVENLHLR
jgi:hypothetical protein